MGEHTGTFKQNAIQSAHRYSLILSVFEAVARVPEMASGILLNSPDGPVLITAGHVLQRFLDLGPNGRLQIGAHKFTVQGVPRELMKFSPNCDLAGLKLETEDLKSVGKDSLPLAQIRYSSVEEGELVAFVGYPGYWKEPRGNQIGAGSYEFFGPVRTVEPHQFSILVDSTYEMRVATTRPGSSVGLTQSLGGLSGAPIFDSGEIPSLVGWIFEGNLWSPTDHKLYAIHANALTSDAWA
jgi:hypothetical protein